MNKDVIKKATSATPHTQMWKNEALPRKLQDILAGANKWR
jgi:hypothetical protein